ncbi:metabotropic glutamate receptor 2-like protein, partial [Leptotrombidium deliense]
MDESDMNTFMNQGGIFSLEAFYFALDKVNQMNLIPGVRFGSKVLNGAKLNESAVETFEPFAKLSKNGLKNGEPKLIGVIEGSTPLMKAHVKKLYDDYKIPLIFSASRKTLSETNFYVDDYYAKACPTVVTQMKPIYSILKKLNYKDVQMITHTKFFAEKFEADANKEGITVTNTHIIPFPPKNLDSLANTLIEKTTTKAIFMLHSPLLETSLFKSIQSKNTTKTFQWISAHMANYKIDYNGVESIANNLIATDFPYPEKLNENFMNYLESLRPGNNKRNEWFEKFWENAFGCNFKENTINGRECSTKNNISLTSDQAYNMPIVSVFNAVYAYAFGFLNAWEAKCERKSGICANLRSMSPQTLFKEYVLKVKFDGLNGDKFSFHDNEVDVSMPITQYQRYLGKYRFRPVGTWRSMALNNFKLSDCDDVQSTYCTPYCETGYRKVEDDVNPCCWNCVKCAKDEIIVDDITCLPCKVGSMPALNKAECVPIDLAFINTNLNEKYDKLSCQMSHLQHELKPNMY